MIFAKFICCYMIKWFKVKINSKIYSSHTAQPYIYSDKKLYPCNHVIFFEMLVSSLNEENIIISSRERMYWFFNDAFFFFFIICLFFVYVYTISGRRLVWIYNIMGFWLQIGCKRKLVKIRGKLFFDKLYLYFSL